MFLPLPLTSQQRKISQFITFSQQYFFSTHPCLPPPHREKKLTSCQLVLKQFIFPSPTCDFLLSNISFLLTLAFRLPIEKKEKSSQVANLSERTSSFLLPHVMFLPPCPHLRTVKNLTINHFSHRNASFRLNIPTEKKLTKCHFLRNDFLFLLPDVMFLHPPFTSQLEKDSIYQFLAPISLFYPP